MNNAINQKNEKLFAALASERTLAKDWDSKEDEEAWKDLRKVKLPKVRKWSLQ